MGELDPTESDVDPSDRSGSSRRDKKVVALRHPEARSAGEVARLIASWEPPRLTEAELAALAEAYRRSEAKRVMPFIGWLVAHGVGSVRR